MCCGSCNVSRTPLSEPQPVVGSEYSKSFSTTVRVSGLAAFILTTVLITVFALFCSNHLLTFPHDFVNMFTHASATNLVIGFGVTTILAAGAAWVIRCARKKKDLYVENQIFSSSNLDNYIEEVNITRLKPGTVWSDRVYIDKSTLDDKGKGKAYLYMIKNVRDHYSVSTIVPLATPIYTVGTIAYHTIRMCVVPFYVLICLAIEACTKRPLFEEQRRFKLVDVVNEPWKSLKHIVKAPFYGLAYMAAGIYSFVNPMGGRILAAKIERDWNEGASRAQGFWSVAGPQGLWDGWGELGPNNLGQFKFFLAGCWQPIGVVDCEGWKITHGKSLSRLDDEKKGYEINVS